jgi:hypothetical protein
MSFPALAFCKPYFSGMKNPSLQGRIHGAFAKGKGWEGHGGWHCIPQRTLRRTWRLALISQRILGMKQISDKKDKKVDNKPL